MGRGAGIGLEGEAAGDEISHKLDSLRYTCLLTSLSVLTSIFNSDRMF